MSGEKRRERTFRRLLRLYPRGHRAEFGDEMCAVFADALEEGPSRGSVAAFAWRMREFGGLVAGAVRERLRAFRLRPRIPGHPALRGAIGFGLGFMFLVPVRALLPLAGKLGGQYLSYPFDLSLVLQAGAYGCIGVLSAITLGPLLWRRNDRMHFRRRGRIAMIVACCAVGGALVTLFVRIPYIALLYRRMLLNGLLELWIDGTILGCFIGAGFGAAKRSALEVLRTAGLGTLAFGSGFAICGLPISIFIRGLAGVGWIVILRLSHMLITGLLSGGLFGWALQRGNRKETTAA